MAEDNARTEWITALNDAVAEGNFVKLRLSHPTAQAGDLKSIDVRPIMVKRALRLSFTYHHKTRDIVKNHPPHESAVVLGALLDGSFTHAHLYSCTADMQLTRTQAGFTLTRHTPTHTQPPELSHDRAKQRLIESTNKPYLHALNLTDAKGTLYKAAQDKFRQINKYIEILDGLLKQLPARARLNIVDMGAGKGYLTFALYDHLVNNLHLSAEVVGVEYRADLVAQCNGIAQASGFTGLRFVQGSIAEYDCSGADVVIALHACDTATDDAIHKAMQAGASLIVVAPCCHKQIRRAMAPAAENTLAPLLQYGTYTERLAEMLTDSMRAQLMELNGYRSNLFEFIADAHTPKNVMIVASKSTSAAKPQEIAQQRNALAALKAEFGISHHQLERLLGGDA